MGEWKIKKRKVGRKWLKWLFGWEESGERKLVRLGVFLLEPNKTHSLHIVEIIGEKTFITFFCFFCLRVLIMFLFSSVVDGFCFYFIFWKIFLD